MKVKNLTTTLFSICFFLIICILIHSTFAAVLQSNGTDDYDQAVKRTDFPDGFLFGAASASYQIEGAFLEDGKSLNSWDIFTHISPATIDDGSNGDIATDHYHHYPEDIESLLSIGADAYRFSISWSRILPRGRFDDVNPKGIEFYDRIINELVLKGIKPFVTIHHYDVPQILEAKFGGWLSPLMQDEFVAFADVCFNSFGDRVKHWMTINEPNLYAKFGYLSGEYPPARCSPPFGNCSYGNSVTEPLIVMHNLLLAHGKSVKLYRQKYQGRQGGVVGIIGSFNGFEPLTERLEDMEAVDRAYAYSFGWMLEPLIFGEYPFEMRRFLGSELPLFSPMEIQIVKGSLDFIGINHYTVFYVGDCLHLSSLCSADESNPAVGFLKTVTTKDGVPIGEPTAFEKFCVVPRGMKNVVEYLKNKYNNTPLYITENGYAGACRENIEDALNDYKRIEYMRSYLSALTRAIKNGADVRGYFAWSLMDSFEWVHGYTLKFGLYNVDFRTLRRTPKLSAKWYSEFLAGEDENGKLKMLTENRGYGEFI